MPNIQWETRTYRDLGVEQLFTMLRLRIDVFVVEQQCAYHELDDYDQHNETQHLLGKDKFGNLIAYTRLLPAGLMYSEVSMGRFVVKKDMRGQGIGHLLLRTVLQEITQTWPGRSIRIAAQDHLQSFYEQYGFLRVSDTFLDHGVPHIEMLKTS